MKKLLIMVCSLGKNVEMADKISEIATSEGHEVKTLNLVNEELPLYSTKVEAEGIPTKAKEIADVIIGATSLIIVAPEYNGSMPPVLNNTIAWVSRSGDDWRKAFNGKPVLIGTHSGGGGAHVLMAMRQQLSYLGANVLGRQLLTNFGKALNEDSVKACLQQLN